MRHRAIPEDNDSVRHFSVDGSRAGIAGAEELRRTVRTALGDLFSNFLRQLPVALSERGRRAATIAEQRTCREFASSISTNAPRWMDNYVRNVDANLIGDEQPSRAQQSKPVAPDDAIALANVELRAEAAHRKMIGELDARLDRVRLTHYLPLHTKALAPAALCRALQDTADSMGWPPSQRRVLFDKFEEFVIGELSHLYQSLLDALARLGGTQVDEPPIGGAPAFGKPVVPPLPPLPEMTPRAAEPAPDVKLSPDAPTAIKPPDTPPKVDDQTLSMLQSYAASASSEGYNDGSLAADLLALGDQKQPDGVDDARWVPLQRMSLAGHFLNEAISDPFVSPDQRPQHESVRFPLVKSALTDSTLFTAVTHPLRSLVNELMLKSATSRITGSAEARRMAELLQQVLVQFDLAPDFVREAMLTATPIDESQIQRFFELQKQQAVERRNTVVNEAKRLVVRELELRTFARPVPPSAIKFLNSAWGPLLVKRLLKYGAGHASWKEGLETMELLLDELELRDPEETPPADWVKLMKGISDQLAAEGLAAERLADAMNGLEQARKTLLS
jgi:hypothetical protein